MFKTIHTNANFSEKQIDAIRLGVDLTKRSLYRDNKDAYKQYATFSGETYNGLTYEQHLEEFKTAHEDAAYTISNLDKTNCPLKLAFSMPHFVTAYFSVIQEVIDNINSKNEIEEVLNFASVYNMAEGDSMNITVKPTNAYFFMRSALGKTFGTMQRYNGTPVVLAPQPNESSVAFSRSEIVSGRVDWGREIARAVRGIRSGYLQDVSNYIFDNTVTSPIGNKTIYTGSYSESDFRTKLQLIAAQNGSSNTYIYGTNIALAPILPATSNLLIGLGVEYMEKGFLATPFGYRAIEIPQAVKADNSTIILSNNYVVAMSIDVGSKPVAIGISGETRIQTQTDGQNAGESFIYTVKSDWDVKFGGQGRFLLYKTN